MTKILQAIRDYYRHIQDAVYIESLLSENREAVVFDTLLEMLNSPDERVVGDASLFMRDVALLPGMGTVAQHFARQYVYSSEFIQRAEALLFSINHFIREHALYLLAKLCSYNSVGEIQRAFDTFQETDPLLLRNLIFELQWLKADNYWQLLQQTASSQNYLTRWAGMSTLRNIGGLDQDQVWAYLQSLAHDPHPLLRTQVENELVTLSRSKKASRDLKLGWDDVEIRFLNYLHHNGRTKYTIEELDQFVQSLFGLK